MKKNDIKKRGTKKDFNPPIQRISNTLYSEHKTNIFLLTLSNFYTDLLTFQCRRM